MRAGSGGMRRVRWAVEMPMGWWVSGGVGGETAGRLSNQPAETRELRSLWRKRKIREQTTRTNAGAAAR